MPLKAARKVGSTLARWKLAWVGWMSMTVSGLVLVATGWVHIFASELSLTANLLARFGLDVSGSLGLSLGGFLTLFAMLVGATVLLNGVYLLYAVARGILDSVA